MADEMLRAQFPDLMQKQGYWEAIVTEKMDEHPPADYDKLFWEIKGEGKDIKITEVIGLAPFEKTSEYQDARPDRKYPSYDQTLTFDTYSKYIVVSMELKDDDQYRIIVGERSSDLANAWFDTKGIWASTIFNNAFTSNTSDGQYLIDTDHPYYEGSSSTISNKLASNAALTHTSVNSLYNQMMYTVDGRGKRIRIKPDYLVVPPALEDQGRKILTKGYEPGSSDNTRNVAADKGLELVVVDWLTSQTAWFLVQKPKNKKHPLIFGNRKPMNIITGQIVKKAGADEVTAFGRFVYGVNGYKGIAGSTGA